MVSIRENTFETNSSSVHSLTICPEEDYKDWEDGKLLFCKSNERFVERDTLYETCIEELKKNVEELENNPDREKYDWDKQAYACGKYVLEHLPTKEDFYKYLDEQLKDGYFAIGQEDSQLWDAVRNHESLQKIETDDVCLELISALGEDDAIATESGYYDGQEYFETYCEQHEIKGVKFYAFGYYGHD